MESQHGGGDGAAGNEGAMSNFWGYERLEPPEAEEDELDEISRKFDTEDDDFWPDEWLPEDAA